MRKDVIGNQFNLISICGRISNMGEAINMLSFNIIFFKFNSSKLHSQKSLSCFFCNLSVPILNGQTLIACKQS